MKIPQNPTGPSGEITTELGCAKTSIDLTIAIIFECFACFVIVIMHQHVIFKLSQAWIYKSTGYNLFYVFFKNCSVSYVPLVCICQDMGKNCYWF